jgi:quercetin dioxygenase-like cupin family protein
MFGLCSPDGYAEIVDGIRIKTLCRGASTLMARFVMRSGALLPEHAHPYEQTGFLVSGRMRLYIGGSSRELSPGDSWCIPADERHRAEILEDSSAVEVFSPPRTDYMAYLNEADITQ